MVILFYLNLNKKFEAFLEITNYSKLIGGFDKIKFRQNELKMLKVGCSIVGFFLLILGILPKLTPNIVNKSLEIPKVFSKKDFEIRLCDRSRALITAFVLSPFKANNATEKQGCKQDIIYLGGV